MRHDGYEYDRIRRKAEFEKARKAGLDDDADLDEEVDPDRIKQMHAEYKQEIERRNIAENIARAEAMARETAEKIALNKRQVLGEWKSLGVKCPWVDNEGFPKVSVSLALSLGWKIGEDERGDKYLIEPPRPQPRTEPTRYNEMGT